MEVIRACIITYSEAESVILPDLGLLHYICIMHYITQPLMSEERYCLF